MSRVSSKYEANNMLVDLVTDNPLAWLVSPDMLNATLLPFLPVLDSQQNIVAIEGHMARTNAHVMALKAEKSAAILYKGPDAYIPTDWVENKGLAPTWAFSSAVFQVDIELLPKDLDTQEHLKRLVAFMENSVGSNWRTESMGDRFGMLSVKVIAFRATVRAVKTNFKLCQNETPGVFKEMVSGLEQAGKSDVASWMARACSQSR